MIVRFTPEQVGEQWEVVKQAVITVFPANTVDIDRSANIILQNLLSSIMQCWAIVVDNQVNAIVVTATVYTPVATKSMLIYAIYIYNPISNEEFLIAYEDLKRYALANNYKDIVGYINSQCPILSKLLEIAKKVEHTREIFITIPIGG